MFCDYHVQIEYSFGYTEVFSAVSASDLTALQVAASVQHQGNNATEDFVTTIKVFGNTFVQPKAALIRERRFDVIGRWNATNEHVRKTVRSLFKSIAA